MLEALAYSITRGAVRAYLDTLDERSKAKEEEPNAVDNARADRFADAVRMQRAKDNPGSKDPASPGL